ncbi:MAG: lysine biosynthesis protein LysW [Candidatus Paceibacterota bacterium]
MSSCKECGSPIPLEDEIPDIGDVIVCPACGAEHEVISSEPLILELIEEEK